MIKLMDMESICILMELLMLETGLMIFRTDMEKRLGLMGQSMRAISKKVRSMEKGCSNGQMEQLIMESLETTILRVMEFMFGQIKEDMKVNGETTKWKGTVSSHGLMAGPIKGPTVMIRKKE